jgi:transcriptional antiterminator RfaH
VRVPFSKAFPVPILKPQTDIFPSDLLAQADLGGRPDRRWWAFYVLSRREKDFMRRLQALGVAFYAPLLTKRFRSPSGRMRTSQVPMFGGYVFVNGDDEARRSALTTNCVSRWLDVPDGSQLTYDLLQIHRLIAAGAPLTPEARLQPGQMVRIRRGSFAGLEGTIVKRHGETRLLVAVRFLQQGASMQLEDCEVEAID